MFPFLTFLYVCTVLIYRDCALTDQVTTLINKYIKDVFRLEVYVTISPLVSVVLNDDNEAIEFFSNMLRVRHVVCKNIFQHLRKAPAEN